LCTSKEGMVIQYFGDEQGIAGMQTILREVHRD
jgi:hypothetical protein